MVGVLNVNNAELLPKVVALTRMGKHVRIPLKGFSMNPYLVGGRDNALLAQPTGKEKAGDVVLVQLQPGRYALHRILWIDDKSVQTIGDGNLTPDPVISVSQIDAIAIGFFRKNREKVEPLDSWKFRTYSTVWTRLRPVRRWLLAFYRRLIMKRKYRNI